MTFGFDFQVSQAQMLEPYQIGVLLVEDELLLQLNRVQQLTDAGLFPFLAATAEDALVLLERRSDIRVVVTDVKMQRSDMDGFELARVVSSRWPHIGVLIVSDAGRPTEGDLASGARFLDKPSDPQAIINFAFGHVEMHPSIRRPDQS